MLMSENLVNTVPKVLFVDKKKMKKIGWCCSVCGTKLKHKKGGTEYICNNCELTFKVAQ